MIIRKISFSTLVKNLEKHQSKNFCHFYYNTPMDSYEEVLAQIDKAVEHLKGIKNISEADSSDLKLRVEELLELLYSPEEQESNMKHKDRKKAQYRVDGFNPKESQVWKKIWTSFGKNLSKNELQSLAEVIASHFNLKLDREAKRRKEVLIKWFDENAEDVLKLLPYLEFQDNDGLPIKF